MGVNLVVVGSLNYDLVTFTPRVPDAGETIQADLFERHTGGKGFNEAIALARVTPKPAKLLSHKVLMIGKVGDDTFGQDLVSSLRNEGVDTSKITVEPNVQTGVATILVEQGGENRILCTPGANDLLRPSPEELAAYFPDLDKQQTYVVLQNEFPFFAETITWLRKNRPTVQVAYNPSPLKGLREDYLKGVDLLIVNDIEATQVLELLNVGHLGLRDGEDKITHYQRLALELLGRINNGLGSLNLVIVTLGSLGVVYATGKKGQQKADFLEAYKVAKEKVVDTTGAGDTFFGSVVSQLSLDPENYEKAIKFASVASALAIQKTGAGESIPTYSQVASLIEQHRTI